MGILCSHDMSLKESLEQVSKMWVVFFSSEAHEQIHCYDFMSVEPKRGWAHWCSKTMKSQSFVAGKD